MKHLVLIAITMALTAAAQAQEPRPVVHGDWEMPASEWAQEYHPANFIKAKLSRPLMKLSDSDISKGLGTIGALVDLDNYEGGSGIVVSGNGQPFDLLLTAGHNFFSPDCKPYSYNYVFLYGGRINTKRYVRLKHVIAGASCYKQKRYSYNKKLLDEKSRDWAIAILENTQVTDTYGSIEARDVEGPIGKQIQQVGAKFMTAGYHKAENELMKSPGGKIVESGIFDDPRFIFTESSSIGAWSGGPGLVEFGDKVAVIGTIIGGPDSASSKQPNFLVRISGEFAKTLFDLRENGFTNRKDYGGRWLELNSKK